MPPPDKAEHKSECSKMRVIKRRSVLSAAVLAIVLARPRKRQVLAFAAIPSRQNRILQNVPGLSAEGYHGFYPMPQLAGQQTQYIENQLHAYIEGRRKNSYMYNVAHVLSPANASGSCQAFQRSQF